MAKPNRGQSKQRGSVYSEHFKTVKFPLKQNQSPHGRVTAVSMMKDEGPFVLEWIAHHIAVGFTDLLVFTNDCSDGTDDMLFRLEELGLAHHRRNVIPPGIRPQPSAIKHAQVDPLVCASDWVLLFDADEFLCIRHGDGSIDGMISSAKEVEANGIVITWRTFGSGGVHEWSREPVSEQYQHAAPTMWNKGWGVKTLFQFDPDYWKLGIHRPKIKNKHLTTGFPDTVKWLNGSGQPMEDYFKFRGWRSIVRTVGYDWAQMNHYAVKSIDSYAIRKFRGNVNLKKDKYNSDYWALQDRNEVFDDSILRYSERRNEIFETLLGDPALGKLHFRAVEQAEARLEEFKKTPDYSDLVASLKEASNIPITQVAAKPPKQRDPAKIAALMSDVEKMQSRRPKAERRSGANPDWGKEGDLYVSGQVNSAIQPRTEVFENKGLKIPADPRIFTAYAMQMITDGKFERNSARRIPKLLGPGSSYLEIGSGIGFLPAVIAKEKPEVKVTVQEETETLAAKALEMWKLNGLKPGPRLALTSAPLFDADDDPQDAQGLVRLIRETCCRVLVINDPRIDEKMLLGALQSPEINMPEAIVLGARALNGAMNDAGAIGLLAECGFAPNKENPLSSALLMVRKASRTTAKVSEEK